MQSKRLAILLAVLLTYFPVMAQETAFTVDDLVQQGILEGDGNGDFRLESPVTRAEMAKMLGNALKLEKIAPVSFSDAPALRSVISPVAEETCSNKPTESAAET